MNGKSLILALMVLVVSQACDPAPKAAILKAGKGDTSFPIQLSRSSKMTTSVATIEAKGENQWLIRVERHFQGESAIGEVVVKQATAPNPENPPHVNLAISKAWLALGESRLAAHDVEGAISCARSGLDELGEDYASPLVADDTQMKLLVANERIQEGHPEDGATIMLRMLRTRTELYKELHQSTLVDQSEPLAVPR